MPITPLIEQLQKDKIVTRNLNPLKILLLSHKFYPDIGGIESVSEMLADEFERLGQEVKVLTWSVVSSSETKTFNYPVIRKPSLLKIIRSMIWADLVFENNPSLRLSWPNVLVRKPLVVALHTWIRRLDFTLGLPQKLKFYWLNRANRVIACSDALRNETFPAAVTIGNPYNDLLFKINQHHSPTKDFVFLGRLVSDKGVDLAIRSFALLLQKMPELSNTSFTIIGDGVEKKKLEQLAYDLQIADKVIFSGSMQGQALANQLNDHRYLIIPSLWQEPFGIVALEGMACGCLPIVSNSGGLPDAIGAAGVVFTTGKAEHLTEQMIRLKKNPVLETDIRMAAASHLEKHKAVSVAHQYLQVLQEAVQYNNTKAKQV